MLDELENSLISQADCYFQPLQEKLTGLTEQLDFQEQDIKGLGDSLTEANQYLKQLEEVVKSFEKEAQNTRLQHNQTVINELSNANMFYLEQQSKLAQEEEMAQQNYQNLEVKSDLIQLNPDFNLEVSRAKVIEKNISDLQQLLKKEKTIRNKEVEACERKMNLIIKKYKN